MWTRKISILYEITWPLTERVYFNYAHGCRNNPISSIIPNITDAKMPVCENVGKSPVTLFVITYKHLKNKVLIHKAQNLPFIFYSLFTFLLICAQYFQEILLPWSMKTSRCRFIEAQESASWKFAEPHFAFVKPLGSFSSSSCICLKFTSNAHHERRWGMLLNWLVWSHLCPDGCVPLIYHLIYLLSINFVVDNNLIQPTFLSITTSW